MIFRHISPTRIVVRSAKQKGEYAVLATEEPDVARQKLIMSGRCGRSKVTLVYGDDSSVHNVVGSASLHTRGTELIGVLRFATDSHAQVVRLEWLAGTLTTALITNPLSGFEVMRGETLYGMQGPGTLVTEWEALQVVLAAA